MLQSRNASLADAFERALEIIQARVSISGSRAERIGIAYSGGLDSSALLHLAHAYASKHGITLFAFHIHHGISPHADAWLLHCERECARLGIQAEMRRVTLHGIDRDGVEQAARVRRYSALGELCKMRDVSLLLTAHHLDDQAETVLLQLLRGAGVAGLSGMAGTSMAPDLLGNFNVHMGRPLLEIPRAELERFVVQKAIRYVEDESNVDARYARNALRHKILPLFDQYFPGFQQRFARASLHAQSAQRLLNEIAEQDLAGCLDGESLDLKIARQYSSDRIDNLLRHWLASHDLRMPTTAWLAELREQLFTASEDAQVCVQRPDCQIRRYRDKIFLIPQCSGVLSHSQPETFQWQGEARIDFPSYGGALYFDEADEGVNRKWLLEQCLQIRGRSGGEKLKLAPDRPTKSLKHHYQALGIPAWERQHLPVVCVEGDRVLFAAGVGMNWREIASPGGAGIRLRWEKNSG